MLKMPSTECENCQFPTYLGTRCARCGYFMKAPKVIKPKSRNAFMEYLRWLYRFKTPSIILAVIFAFWSFAMFWMAATTHHAAWFPILLGVVSLLAFVYSLLIHLKDFWTHEKTVSELAVETLDSILAGNNSPEDAVAFLKEHKHRIRQHFAKALY